MTKRYVVPGELIHAQVIQTDVLDHINRQQYPTLYHVLAELLKLSCDVVVAREDNGDRDQAIEDLEEFLR